MNPQIRVNPDNQIHLNPYNLSLNVGLLVNTDDSQFYIRPDRLEDASHNEWERQQMVYEVRPRGQLQLRVFEARLTLCTVHGAF